MYEGLDDNSLPPNSRKAPKTIPMFVKDGRYRDAYIPEDLYQELREAVSEHERLQGHAITAIRSLSGWT
jgi:hypothetical protein